MLAMVNTQKGADNLHMRSPRQPRNGNLSSAYEVMPTPTLV